MIEKRSALLAPLASEYEPTDADAERVFAKLAASHGAEIGCTRPSSSPPDGGGMRAAWRWRAPILVGLSCVAVAVVGTRVLQTSTPTPTSANAVARQRDVASAPAEAAETKPTEPTEQTKPTKPTEPAAVSVDALPTALPSASQGARKAVVARANPAASSASSDGLEREARLLSDARSALKNGDGVGALTLLDEHARTFPRGWLVAERAAERIVVLCSLGRREDAVHEATAFLAGRPKSPLTRRVETSCAGTSTESDR